MPYNTRYVYTAYEVLTAANLNNNDENLDYLKSKADRKTWSVRAFSPSQTIVTGDGAAYFPVPADLNGMDLVAVGSVCYTVSSSGVVQVQIHNLTSAVDVLSTRLEIDASEYSSYTAATPAVINTANDNFTSGDRWRIDVDAAGTGAKGLDIIFSALLS